MLASILSGTALSARTIWMVIGFVAQGLFASRFVVQWLASERAKASVVPTAFWYLSLTGGLMLLAYAIYRRDPVFIAGQAVGSFIYVRNLFLIRRTRARGSRPQAI
jgi:lipid-A-disaccharide synthase-like uncharacterized protein